MLVTNLRPEEQLVGVVRAQGDPELVSQGSCLARSTSPQSLDPEPLCAKQGHEVPSPRRRGEQSHARQHGHDVQREWCNWGGVALGGA